MARLSIWVLICTAILGVATGVKADCSKPNTIAELSDCWQKSWNGKQIDALMQLYANDGTLLTFDGRFTGREAIRAYLKTKMDSANIQFVFTSEQVAEPNKIGYQSGVFQESTTAVGGATQRQDGNYLLVVLKDEKGGLLIVQHAFVTKKASPPTAPCPQCLL